METPVLNPAASHPLWQHQLGLLLESTGEGIFGVDLDGHCMFINRAGALRVILPAAALTILTGMRISMIAWLVIVAAEMLVGGTGIGYFVWNEWNNLSLTNVIFAILVIGVVGMLLDQAFAGLQRKVTYVE
jgi:ABC-type nitrate/sulfonate/bicarbonate transport system permease component